MTKESEKRSLSLLMSVLSYGQQRQLKKYGVFTLTEPDNRDHVFIIGRRRMTSDNSVSLVTLVGASQYIIFDPCFGVGTAHGRAYDRYDEMATYALSFAHAAYQHTYLQFPVVGNYEWLPRRTMPHDAAVLYSKAFFGMEHIQLTRQRQPDRITSLLIARCIVCGQFRRRTRKHDHEYRRTRAS